MKRGIQRGRKTYLNRTFKFYQVVINRCNKKLECDKISDKCIRFMRNKNISCLFGDL
jgi:hypothetical protein